MSAASTAFTVHKAAKSKIQSVDWDNLPFGKIFTDHMFVMEYANGAWQQGEILPFGPIDIHPAMSAIHYGPVSYTHLRAHETN
jgi:branched-chain amino acid aminotransferase